MTETTHTHRLATLLFASLVSSTIFGSACLAAPEEAKGTKEPQAVPLTMEEIKTKRKEARETLMLPSLEGVRGIAYRVIGYRNFEPLEKQLAAKLQQLDVPLFPASQLKEGDKPIDAIVQVSYYKTGNNTIAEMTVTQWASLLRSPKTKVRAVTYHDKLFLPGNRPEQALNELSDQFVIDFLKANQKAPEKGPQKASAEASGKSPKQK
ncbi:MAG TPA: hypothetical protein V6D17_09430 [Candidatus Obscuribacterales bacterium]